MYSLKRLLVLCAIIFFGLSIVISGLALIASNYIVDIWWFRAVGYELYYWQQLLYRYFIFAAVGVFFFLLFFLNFWVASRYLGTANPAWYASKKVYHQLLREFQKGSMLVYLPFSIILAIPLALPVAEHWEQFLLYLFGPSSGITDPFYGKDISYYLFSFPIYTMLQSRLLIAFLFLCLGLVLLYWAENRALSQEDGRLHSGARWHLSILILLTFFIAIWGLILQRYWLLYGTPHQPLFFGPGFVQMRLILPFIWICILLLLGVAVSTFYSMHRQRGLKTLAVLSGLFLLFLTGRYTRFLPDIVQHYVVKPNALNKEKPFIRGNIEATLAAYGLDRVENRDFVRSLVPTSLTSGRVQDALKNIPVWDAEELLDVYKQLQELRTYYAFKNVHVARYTVEGDYQQVYLAARELNQQKLPPGARNWINEHLVYTHGYGAVMTPASQVGGEPITWFIEDVPPTSDYGFSIEQPGIYYGLESLNYVLAPNRTGEIDYPSGQINVMTDYAGKGGVPISNFLARIVFSYYFQDKNLLFTDQINDKSKILFRRNVIERIGKIAPYLLLDSHPYLAVTSKGLFWIQDAYTTSAWSPDSPPSSTEKGDVNYIRNSVKIVVDAYNGSVDLYVFDPKDPIIRAYREFYPYVYKDMAQMPEEIRSQVRYPQDLFAIQMKIYAKYHQTDPAVFYQQEDMWEFAKVFYDSSETRIGYPYYLTLELIEPGRLNFILMVPMIPKGKSNFRALPIVGCDPGQYGKIIVYNFPQGELVYGPLQIYSLVDENTEIAQRFTLWDQRGSKVTRGRMVIIPIDKTILYIQPVYLVASSGPKIPMLQRLIMSQGEMVVMGPSLHQDYEMLEKQVKEDMGNIEKSYHPKFSNPPP